MEKLRETLFIRTIQLTVAQQVKFCHESLCRRIQQEEGSSDTRAATAVALCRDKAMKAELI